MTVEKDKAPKGLADSVRNYYATNTELKITITVLLGLVFMCFISFLCIVAYSITQYNFFEERAERINSIR